MHTKMRKSWKKKGDAVFDKILCSFLYISKRWRAGGEGKGIYCQREDKTKAKEKWKDKGQLKTGKEENRAG